MKYRTIVADPPWPINAFPPNFGYETGKPTPYQTMPVDDIAAMPVQRLADAGAHLYLWTINDYLTDAFHIARAWGFEPSATLVWCKKPAGVGLGGVFASNVEFVLFCRMRGGPVELAVTSRLADAAVERGLSRRDIDRHMGTSDMAGWWLSKLVHRCSAPSLEQYQRLKQLLCLDNILDAEIARIDALRQYESKMVETRWFQWPRGAHSQKPEAFIDLVEQVSPGPYVELFSRRHRLGWDVWGDESANTAELGA